MDFKILWIDDTLDWVASIQGAIEDHIRDQGFTPEVILQEDDANIDDFIFRSDIDMIIVDFHLDGTPGDQVIKHLREKGNFVEIVFYSQDVAALLEEVSAHTEHVHCVARDEAEDKIKMLVDFTKHKCGDLGYIRGSVIAETIDVENIIERIMVSSFGQQGDRFRTRVLDKPGIYDFMKKYEYIQGLLKASCTALEKKPDKDVDESDKLKLLKELRDIMKNFGDEVVGRRNTLAHAQKEWGEDGKLHLRGLNKKKQDIDVSREWMMEMRSILARYRGVLTRIFEESLLLESEEPPD